MSSNYSNSIYNMYEKEVYKNDELIEKNKSLKLEVDNLKYQLNYLKQKFDKQLESRLEKEKKTLIDENNSLKELLDKAYDEINRLKSEIEKKKEIENDEKDYTIDKLTNQLAKDSSNSGIPTSKQLTPKEKKTGPNIYSHREKSSKTTGGQFGHKGKTLTKEEIEKLKADGKVEVRIFNHATKGKSVTKYRVGVEMKPYIEEHNFIHSDDCQEGLPRSFYSDVTYNETLKTIILFLGCYCSLSYSKVAETLYDFSNGLIKISQGTIDNIYEEFTQKSEETIINITNNIMNGPYQHTDETVTSENGKQTYYRGYCNDKNVLYRYHPHKGDAPIKEDNILNNYFGTIISDHDTTVLKYGTSNQDCIVHISRYCKERYQNVYETNWPMELCRLLLRAEIGRELIKKFGQNYFVEEDIKRIEKEYDEILERAKIENENIKSTYWKEKQKTFCNRMIKYKNATLFYIHDFSIPFDNNLMERNLRMIKTKTKMSGGFRSSRGGERFGNIMSIIKTSKLRKVNVFENIKQIFEGQALFA